MIRAEALHIISSELYHDQLKEKQIDGIEALLNGCDQFGVSSLPMRAYILATAYWETARTMQPIEEFGKGAGHKYGQKIKQNGEPYTAPDKIYYGRGHTQNTWYENYRMLSNESYAKSQGWDFLNNPELLLQTAPSVWATIHCMYNCLYTGVGLKKYFTADGADPVNARRIINGTDQAQQRAGFYHTFLKALSV